MGDFLYSFKIFSKTVAEIKEFANLTTKKNRTGNCENIKSLRDWELFFLLILECL